MVGGGCDKTAYLMKWFADIKKKMKYVPELSLSGSHKGEFLKLEYAEKYQKIVHRCAHAVVQRLMQVV